MPLFVLVFNSDLVIIHRKQVIADTCTFMNDFFDSNNHGIREELEIS